MGSGTKLQQLLCCAVEWPTSSNTLEVNDGCVEREKDGGREVEKSHQTHCGLCEETITRENYVRVNGFSVNRSVRSAHTHTDCLDKMHVNGIWKIKQKPKQKDR